MSKSPKRRGSRKINWDSMEVSLHKVGIKDTPYETLLDEVAEVLYDLACQLQKYRSTSLNCSRLQSPNKGGKHDDE